MSDPAQPSNPYEAPTARLSDQTIAGASGDLIENGRRVPAGNGPRWIRLGWDLFKVKPGAWIGILLIAIVIVVVASLIPLVGGLVNILVQPLLLGGIMTACRAADRGEPVRVSALFSAFSTHLGPLALLGLLQFAAYIGTILVLGILAAVTIGGAASMGMLKQGPMGSAMLVPFILLGIVGFAIFILIAMANWFAPALIVLQGIGPIDAMRMSFLACLKNIVAFLLYVLVALLLAIAASLPVFLGWLVLGPVMYCSIYAAFRDLFFAQA